MTRVLLIGYAPEAVDFSDPALPPGLNAEKIAEGIKAGMADFRSRGWEADFCSIKPDETIGADVSRWLAAKDYDCIVIGAGVRMSARLLPQFETVINAVHRGAPNASIAFNTRPDDSAAAAERQLKG